MARKKGPKLKGAQSSNLAAKATNEGGFSVSVSGGKVEGISSAYLVGGQAPTTSLDMPITGANVSQYVRSRPELRSPEFGFGAWHDSDRQPKAQVDLDVIKQFPVTPEGKRNARTETLAKGEIAYGEVDASGGYAGEHNNPFAARRMGRNADNESTYTTVKAARLRGQHFRSGINSEALAHLMSGNPEAARQSWIHA